MRPKNWRVSPAPTSMLTMVGTYKTLRMWVIKLNGTACGGVSDANC
ncbi:MAG: hypothetical protein GDYSWBUE_002117 [Candidatus Fervidibacterota bacterium]